MPNMLTYTISFLTPNADSMHWEQCQQMIAQHPLFKQHVAYLKTLYAQRQTGYHSNAKHISSLKIFINKPKKKGGGGGGETAKGFCLLYRYLESCLNCCRMEEARGGGGSYNIIKTMHQRRVDEKKQHASRKHQRQRGGVGERETSVGPFWYIV